MYGIGFKDGRVLDKESGVLEFKSALKGIPGSTWETYSAFANSLGGSIFLGIQDKTGVIEGVPDAELRIQEIWDTLNDPQMVNANILRSDDVVLHEFEGKDVIEIAVPRANRF
ncbi:MAG: ATP-binding protein, partial [archaeon]|nr:ATP-binding protein [archaeon]